MRVRRVVVIGHGIAPAMAATALARAFGRGGVSVEWIETPGEIAADWVLGSLPNLRSFHRLLGLAEADVLRAAKATFSLGRQYAGFAEGGDFLHCFGPVGRPIASQPFMQFWIKAAQAGMPARFEDFSRETVAARSGRIGIADTPQVPATAHGYHLDAPGYAGLLRAQAVRSGVTITAAGDVTAAVESARVTAVRLSDGREIAGDLFVDATPGPTVRGALGDADTVTRPDFGCDRLMLASGARLHPLPTYGRVTAHAAGWSALLPLQGRTGVAVAFESVGMEEAQAVALAGMPLASAPVFLSFAQSGELARPWAGNVVALERVEPSAAEMLVPTALHRLQVAVTHLVSLFPVRTDAMPEGEIYKEELGGYRARIDDFEAAQLAASGRSEPFWAAARRQERSAELAAKIDLFVARGMIAQCNQESFAPEEWQACLLGHGLRPRSYDPQVDTVEDQMVMAELRAQLLEVRQQVARMPMHEAALARVLGA